MLISVKIPEGNRWQKVGTEESLVKELLINMWAEDIREASKGWAVVLTSFHVGTYYPQPTILQGKNRG